MRYIPTVETINSVVILKIPKMIGSKTVVALKEKIVTTLEVLETISNEKS